MSDTTFHGPRRKLLLAFDVGTTYSGISYSILDPGQVPEIKGVTKFPGQEHLSGSSKIPTIIYYDRSGKVRAVGAEAELESICQIAEEKKWIKAEWFKLHLRPRFGAGEQIAKAIPPLPLKKTVVDVFGDFLKYLLKCASSYIQATYPNGVDLWKYVAGDIDFVLSHPNGWEGLEQLQMRKAAVLAGLIPDSQNGHSRLSFVTEGEASLHFSLRNGLANDVMNHGQGVIIVDAGGGTIDVSSYSKDTQASKHTFEEIAIPQCHFHGSVFVTIHARLFLEKYLAESSFLDDINHIVRIFDKTTKLRFKQADEAQYVKFGSTRDNDLACNIRFGQLKLGGSDVASFFQASVDCILKAVLEQRNTAEKPISYIVLVGGFAASPWLFTQVQAALTPSGLTLLVPESHVNKAVSDGAISFYLDHFVRTRVSKFAYGMIVNKPFDPTDPCHQKRASAVVVDVAGGKQIPDGFGMILPKVTQVSESTEFKKPFRRLPESKKDLKHFQVDIWCYRGTIPNPKWKDEDTENYTKVCSIESDLSHLPLASRVNDETQRRYYEVNYSVVLLFGLTEMKAQISWNENEPGEDRLRARAPPLLAPPGLFHFQNSIAIIKDNSRAKSEKNTERERKRCVGNFGERDEYPVEDVSQIVYNHLYKLGRQTSSFKFVEYLMAITPDRAGEDVDSRTRLTR